MKPAPPVRPEHVRIGVRGRQRAAASYRWVLRLQVTYDYAEHGDPHGPLVVSGDGDKTHVALFVDRDAAKRGRRHIGTLAFRVTDPDFLRCLRRVARLNLHSVDGRRVGPGDVVDHGNSDSVYVADPDHNPLEITTYDHDAVERAFRG